MCPSNRVHATITYRARFVCNPDYILSYGSAVIVRTVFGKHRHVHRGFLDHFYFARRAASWLGQVQLSNMTLLYSGALLITVDVLVLTNSLSPLAAWFSFLNRFAYRLQ
jgi:hypothetical protein